MTEEQKIKANVAANASFAGSAGLLSVSQVLDLPVELADLSEPLGLILALVGTALKLIRFFKTKA